MSFTVTLYQFTKKENSTARPSGTGTAYPCVVRTDTGIVNPTIELNLGLTNSPANYNYAYIAEFGRYYFIDEWIFSNRLWLARMSVDALATFKPQVGAASLYILRASADYDGSIIDNKYPTKTGSTLIKNIESYLWEQSVSSGCFVIGVVGQNPKYGSINYYVCDAVALAAIADGLVNQVITDGNDFDVNELSKGLQLNLVDPLSYIKSCVYIPIAFNSMPGSSIGSTINIYKYNISISGNIKELRAVPYIEITRTITLEKHPQTQSRGNFVNNAPFTTIQLTVPPFGIIEIDTSITCNKSSLSFIARVDVPTGAGILTVSCDGTLLNKLQSQVGVSVVLSQVARDYLNNPIMSTIGQAAASAGGLIASVIDFTTENSMLGTVNKLMGNPIKGSSSGIVDAAGALGIRTNSIGSGGSYAQFMDNPRIDYQFLILVDDDINHNGRPLCQMRTPASLGGYMLVQDGDIPIPGTAQEARQVRAYLEGGFYYE